MPLSALDLVSFDIETTGLDPKRARCIEIAAIRIQLGKVNQSETFTSFVDPGISIPESSISIHGISNEHVKGAPSFRDAIKEFSNWAGPRIFLGYGSDFDLAVMHNEHQRFNLLWTPCRTLDLFPLIPLLNLGVSNYGLETVAEKLGIDISDRHRALADARMTAEVFIELLPFLKQNGITTLAEANRVSANSPKIDHRLKRGSEIKPTELSGMDSFPFRRRVKEIMTTPPAVADSAIMMSEAVAEMVNMGVSSLVVRYPDRPDLGIITSGDVMRALSNNGPSALNKSVEECCSQTLNTVSDREFVYRAIVEMKINKVRHLGVKDEDGNLVGAMSGRDLFNIKSQDAISLGSGIKSARTSSELARIWSDLSTIVKALAKQTVDARNISAIISRELRSMTKRACELAEQEIGPSPKDYAMLVLGSAGRGESLLAMDQDNAIVIADGEPEESDTWFATLGDISSKILDEAGVRFCDGGVMGSNPEWRMNASDWNRTVRTWLTRTNTEDILHADIFFDAMCVYGNNKLALEMYQTALDDAQKARPFLRLLAQRACKFDRTTGLFGRWKLNEKGRIDLKKSGIMPIFSAARAAALEEGIRHRSTLRRLNKLKELRPQIAEICDDLSSAHGIILEAILNQQLRDIDNGIPLSNFVKPSDMSSAETQQLKWALNRVFQVSALLGVPSM